MPTHTKFPQNCFLTLPTYDQYLKNRHKWITKTFPPFHIYTKIFQTFTLLPLPAHNQLLQNIIQTCFKGASDLQLPTVNNY